MRFRTKLFLAWAALMVPLWIGALISVQRVMQSRMERMAGDAFAGIKHGLAGAQKERVARMRQATRLLVSIPELRALIAEHNYELTADNRNSLEERLDTIARLVGADFVAVLDRRQVLIAQSNNAAWASLEELDDYRNRAAEPAALIRSVFSGAHNGARDGRFGLWVNNGGLYQVTGTPMVFDNAADNDEIPSEPDGALLIGIRITDQLADELGRSHNAQLTFISNGAIAASSLPAEQRAGILKRASKETPADVFNMPLGTANYLASFERLQDPCSGNTVGTVLIQCDLQAAQIKDEVVHRLTIIMVTGLIAATVVSFMLSSRITRPVQELVAGAEKVARGEFDLALRVPGRGRDEMSLLARSFNDMVAQLRARQQLERLVEDAQAASRAKSQFLANVSHEVRTPLNGVIGMLDLLLGTPLIPQQKRYAGLAKTSAELLTALINDILDFSKIEAGKLELEQLEFELGLAAEEVMELLAEKASKKGVEIACHIQGEVPTHVRGDRDRLRQILVNLVSNAIKFTPAGSVVIRVALQSETADRAMVRFSVTDTGIGIPRERRDRLFKPFSQVDASTTRKFGGTGLGLAISKQLVELMGGSIGVESEDGKGSTFWFVVSLEKGKPPPTPPKPVNPRGVRVLVVSDNETTRSILQEQLSGWKLEAASAAQAEAIALLERAAQSGRAFDMAIVDVDPAAPAAAFELAQSIEAQAAAAAAAAMGKIVIMALLPMEASIDAAGLREHGFAGFILKPVRQSHLFDELMTAMSAASNDVNEDGDAAAAAASAAATARPTMPVEEPPPPRIGTAGRILVAEDNEVNQIVARELLERAGYLCDVVDSGRKAVDAAIAGAYDVILMDCQMPELDGFEATKAIRAHEAAAAAGGGKKRTPIVALTANAVKGDREACLAAGMDEYCTKPIEPKQLLLQIESLLLRRRTKSSNESAGRGRRGTRSKSAGGSTSPSSSSSSQQPIDLNVLRSRCMNSEATVANVLEKFEKQLARDLPELTRSLAADDAETAARTAHALKGAASMVTASEVADIAAALENLARERQLSQSEEQLDRLRAEIERCNEFLKSARTAPAQQTPEK